MGQRLCEPPIVAPWVIPADAYFAGHPGTQPLPPQAQPEPETHAQPGLQSASLVQPLQIISKLPQIDDPPAVAKQRQSLATGPHTLSALQ